MRRSTRGISGQPVLLGAVAVLVAILSIYVVYHADSGLPYVPNYEVRVVLDDAEHFGKTGDVRIAGWLVGKVGERRLQVRPDGSTRALLELKLEKDVEPLPADTRVRMRSQSTLGGNYVELLPGRAPEPLRGSPPTIVASGEPEPISFSESLEAYDARTRAAMTRYLAGAGDTLVGRGDDLNQVIALAPDTMKHLEGAARVLADPDSDLDGFVDGFARLNEGVAPVAEEQAGLFRGLDRTLGALAPVRDDVAAATEAAPPLFGAGIRGFAAQRRLTRETAGVFAALRPGLHALRGAADDVEAASTGSPAAFRSLTRLSPRLAESSEALGRFALHRDVVPSLRTLEATFAALGPTADALEAGQTVCNYPGVALRNLLSVLSDGMSTGNFVGVGAVLVVPAPNGEIGPAAAPAKGPREDSFLHSTLTPLVGQGEQPECEAGNEEYAIGRQAIGNAPGRQAAATERTEAEGSR
jgi:ABC-type transporter Mla subunit MlaD